MLKNFINSHNFFMLPKEFLKILKDNDACVMFSILTDAETFFHTEWFYQTGKTIEDINPAMTRRRQEKSIKILTEKGFIKTKNVGMPQKRYFKIRWNNIEVLLMSKKEDEQNEQNVHTAQNEGKNEQNAQIVQNEVQNVQKVQNVCTKSTIFMDKMCNNKEHNNKEHKNKKHNNIYMQFSYKFLEFWDKFPSARKINKKKAYNIFNKLNDEEKEMAIIWAGRLEYSEDKYCPHPTTFLNQKERYIKDEDNEMFKGVMI